MTVSELIEELKKFPPHHPVLVDAAAEIKSVHGSGFFGGPCVLLEANRFSDDDGDY